MSKTPFQTPVRDDVAKVNDEVAVGEDLQFQRSWWRFEKVVWILFLAIIVCDLAGLFGKGPLSHKQLKNASLQLKYDRIERYGTPSIADVEFNPSTLQNGSYHLFVSESLVQELGAQRVIPSPATTAIGNGGLTYSFTGTPGKASAQFALEPTRPGLFHFTVQVPGQSPIRADVFVMP